MAETGPYISQAEAIAIAQNAVRAALFEANIITNKVVSTYADMIEILDQDDPEIPQRYFVKSDETNGGVSGTYTHFNNALTVVIETDVI